MLAHVVAGGGRVADPGDESLLTIFVAGDERPSADHHRHVSVSVRRQLDGLVRAARDAARLRSSSLMAVPASMRARVGSVLRGRPRGSWSPALSDHPSWVSR